MDDAVPFREQGPPNWDPQHSNAESKDVDRATEEWGFVSSRLSSTDPGQDLDRKLVRVQRVQNIYQYKRYTGARQLLINKYDGVKEAANEVTLFHGTRRTEPRQIWEGEQGFDPRLAQRGLWGFAAYFSNRASYIIDNRYSHYSNGNQVFFMATVLLGLTAHCPTPDNTLTTPPDNLCFATRSIFRRVLCDSVHGFTRGHDVYMIYDAAYTYPTWILTLTM